jgi:hypothetical protein
MCCITKRDCDVGHIKLRYDEIEYPVIVDVRKNKMLESGYLAEIERCSVH